MQNGIVLKLQNQLKTFKNPTKYCKICFNKLGIADFYQVFNGDSCLCYQCQQRLKPKFIEFDIDGVYGLAIYEYDDNIKSILYQFKGCYDIELAPVFLNRFKQELHLMYRRYTLVAAPSYELDNQKREFRHIEEMFKIINLPIIYAIEKITPFKQAEHTKKERGQIIKHLKLVNPKEITGRKVLIVDDVLTTGSTIRAMIELVKTARPKCIKVLVMTKRN